MLSFFPNLSNYWLIDRTRDNETNTEDPHILNVPAKLDGDDDEDKKKTRKM